MINLTLTSAGVSPRVVFVHGAYENVWTWQLIQDELATMNGISSASISIPGSYHWSSPLTDGIACDAREIADELRKYSSDGRLFVVAHSLAGNFISHTLPFFPSDVRIHLLLNGMPIWVPRIFRELRIHAAWYHSLLTKLVPLHKIPQFAKSRCKHDQRMSRALRSMIDRDAVCEILETHRQILSRVAIGVGRLDPYASGLRFQRALQVRLLNAGIDTGFRTLGFTGHWCHIIGRKHLRNWIAEEFMIFDKGAEE